MKLTKLSTLLAVILLAGLSIQAQNPQGNPQGNSKGSHSMGQGGGCGMMMGMYMPHVMTTSDGGVIVVTGRKLIKYDKDLNLKKEIVVPIDTTGVQAMWQHMNQACPMMGQQSGQKSQQPPPPPQNK